MSDHSRWWFADLVVVALLAGLAAGQIQLGTTGPTRIALAMPLLLLFPGYALVALLFPEVGETPDEPFDTDRTGLWKPHSGPDGIDRVVRFALSVVMSVALVAVVALVANVTPWGIALWPILAGLVIVTAGCCLLGLVRRWRCPADRRFAPAVGSFWSGLFYSARDTPFGGPNRAVYNVAIGVSLLLLVTSTGYAVANPPDHEGFTELYVDTDPVSGDDQSMYQSRYVRGESQEFAVNVTNREHEERQYTTVVLLQRVNDSGDGTSMRAETELARDTVTVADGATERQAFDITPTMSGEDLRLVVLLYADGAPADPSADNAYRVLRLPITVEEGENASTRRRTDGLAATESAATADGGP
jgi:uncharacterized membrane protein